eukprot:10314022-Prorocentrum_lima.AAC.1
MTSSLVGSEMCIRDSFFPHLHLGSSSAGESEQGRCGVRPLWLVAPRSHCCCLLYTSDAADDM